MKGIWAVLSSVCVICRVSDGPVPLRRLRVRANSAYLLRKEEKLLTCALEEEEREIGTESENLRNLRLTDIKWYRDGKRIGGVGDESEEIGENLFQTDGPTLKIIGSKHVDRLEGNYRCSGKVEGSDIEATAGPMLSAELRLMEAKIEKFTIGDGGDVVETFQGEVAYIPCAGLPESTPGPPTIWFEREVGVSRPSPNNQGDDEDEDNEKEGEGEETTKRKKELVEIRSDKGAI